MKPARREPYRSFTLRFCEYLWYHKLTRGGRFLLASGIVSGALSASSGLAPTYAIFFSLFFVGLLSWLTNSCYGRKLQVECRLPERAMAGAPVHAAVVVRNTARRRFWSPGIDLDVAVGLGKLPASLRDDSGDACVRILPPGQKAQLTLVLRPLKRGVYSLPLLRGFSTFPFNLFRSGRCRARLSPLVVVPRFTPLEAIDLPVGRLYQPGGFALTTNIGDSPEYIGNRDYQPGDSVRRIDSRAWARLGHPAVREYQEEYYCRVALVLDTFIPARRRTPPEGFAELEGAISLAASVADALTRGEYILDIFAAGPELYSFRAGQSIAHLDNILDILACVEPCRSNPFDKIAPALAEEVANIATVICVLLDWDESRRKLVRMVEEAGCCVKVVLVREGAPSEPLAVSRGDAFECLSPGEIASAKVVRL